MIEMAGFKDPESFYKILKFRQCHPPHKSHQSLMQLKMLAQAEAMKAQVSAQKAMIDAENRSYEDYYGWTIEVVT